MQLSIRDASRFLIGAGLMRQKAIETSGIPDITLENVANAALRGDADSAKIRQAIETLADQQSAWLRSTPPHVLTSDRVMQSRRSEINTYTSIHRAFVSTIQLEAAAPEARPAADRVLRQSLFNALEAIDNTPGSRSDREALLSTLRQQVLAVASDDKFMKKALRDSEQAYLAADLDKTFARYSNPSLARSDDYDDFNV